mmetsp:Transcript_18779/g.24540  ORF Transcript_18779/g.24540 Transcript_18779/m.24540 type:complete len:259 (+) Transcript_18779:1504-2280(+)
MAFNFLFGEGNAEKTFLRLTVCVLLAYVWQLQTKVTELGTLEKRKDKTDFTCHSENEKLLWFSNKQVRNDSNSHWVDAQRLEQLTNPPEPTANDDIDTLMNEWNAYLRLNTPSRYEQGKGQVNLTTHCRNFNNVVIPQAQLSSEESFIKNNVTARAREALKECGFVYLDNLFDRSYLGKIKTAYDKVRGDKDDMETFRYPCQGDKRVEVMLPFREPFNDTRLYGDYRIRSIVGAFLDAEFKLELMTVIDSPPGSGNQR